MGLEGKLRIKKYMLVFINSICMIVGLAILIMGIVLHTGAFMKYIKDFTEGLGGLGVFAMILGAVVFVIAFIGCVGAAKESWCLLFVYAFIMIVVLIASIVGLIIVAVNKGKWEKEIQDKMHHWMNTYKYGITDKKDKSLVWEALQPGLECCGTSSYKGWENATAWQNKAYTGPPSACCIHEDQQKLDPQTNNCTVGTFNDPELAKKNLYSEGCYNKMVGFITDNSRAFIIALVIYILVMLFVVLISCCLAGGIRRSDYNKV